MDRLPLIYTGWKKKLTPEFSFGLPRTTQEDDDDVKRLSGRDVFVRTLKVARKDKATGLLRSKG